MNISLFPFGEIDLRNLENYYDSELEIRKLQVDIDLNFEVETTTQSEIERLKSFIKDLDSLIDSIQNYIVTDLSKDMSMTRDYLSFYLDELDEDELSEIIALNSSQDSKLKQLQDKLRLIRIGLYPNADYYATFDYSIYLDGEPCNQLLVINLNEDGTLNHITWES